MIRYMLTLYLLFSFGVTQGMDCLRDQNGQIINTSLRSDNGSMKDFRIQDQNGYGTCYANALSASIYSITGQEISFQQAALATQSLPETRNVEENENLLSAAGTPCDALTALKTEDVICNRDSAPLESLNDSKEARLEFHNLLSEIYNSGILKDIPEQKVQELKEALSNQKRFVPRVMSKAKCMWKIRNYFVGQNNESLADNAENSIESKIRFNATQNLNNLIELYTDEYRELFEELESVNQESDILEFVKENSNHSLDKIFKTLRQPISFSNDNNEVVQITTKLELHNLLMETRNISLNNPINLNQNFTKSIYMHFANEYNNFYEIKKTGNNFEFQLKRDNTSSNGRNKEAKLSNIGEKISSDDSLKLKIGEEDGRDIFAKDFPGSIFNGSDHKNYRNSIDNLIPGECHEKKFQPESTCPENATSALNKLFNLFKRSESIIGENDGANTSVLFTDDNIDRMFDAKDQSLKDFIQSVTNPGCNLPQNQINKSLIEGLSCTPMNLDDVSELTKFITGLSETDKINFLNGINPNLLQYFRKRNGDFNHRKFNAIQNWVKGEKLREKATKLAKQTLFDKSLLESISNNPNNRQGSLMTQVCNRVIMKKEKECSSHLVNFVGVRCNNGKKEYHMINSYGEEDGLWIDADILHSNDNLGFIFKLSR